MKETFGDKVGYHRVLQLRNKNKENKRLLNINNFHIFCQGEQSLCCNESFSKKYNIKTMEGRR